MVALFKVDTAYGEVMASADGQLKSWRQTVGSGRVVSDFGERVSVRPSASQPVVGGVSLSCRRVHVSTLYLVRCNWLRWVEFFL